MFIHTVYFKLKPDAVGAADDIISDCHGSLARIETVRHLWTGRPVPSDRPVVDGDYDVALCVAFDDKAGHDAYQVHDRHMAFVDQHKASWESVRVTDFA